ncbi:acetyl-CoA acetyltransferase [Pseudonocardia xishanensis]|uniref:Acetyl-CoA acetyltransferase n=1 Tax=Pseudonocardia xishanensis TaxID=630995 RepID=A0ABP8RYC5_9PSEU
MSYWVLGGVQTDFARSLAREGADFAALCSEVLGSLFESLPVEPTDVETIHVANAFGEAYQGQGHLGTMPATVLPQLQWLPASRHEAACASGSMAALGALKDLATGSHCVLVVGLELERSAGRDAGGLMSGASWVGHEADGVSLTWPYVFDRIREEYDRRYGLDDGVLRAISALNLGNARANPLAQTRGWPEVDLAGPAGTSDETNPFVLGGLRRSDCSQITDGGVAVLLVDDEFLDRRPELRSHASRIVGTAHGTGPLGLQTKLEQSADGGYLMPGVKKVADRALAAAGTTVAEIDLFEVHDCFSISELVIVEHLGLAAPGKGAQLLETGQLAPDGGSPVNPSGGLLGVGHPVGASGLRMLLDAHRQVTGSAGDYQVQGARRAMTLNFGGSMATVASLIVEGA